MIPLGHNPTSGAIYYKMLRTLDIRQSFPAIILLNPNNHYNHVYNTFDHNH